MTRNYIAYCKRSMQAGFSPDQQERVIRQHLQAGFGDLFEVYLETEPETIEHGPQLAKALTRCQETGAILLLARLERLGKDIPFLTALEQSGVNFIFIDFPAATRETIGIILALARYERSLNRQRAKSLLAAETAGGLRFANPANISPEAAKVGRERAISTNRTKADEFALVVGPIANGFRSEGASLSGIAARFNADRALMPSGKCGQWTATAVKNLLARYALLTAPRASQPVPDVDIPTFGL